MRSFGRDWMKGRINSGDIPCLHILQVKRKVIVVIRDIVVICNTNWIFRYKIVISWEEKTISTSLIKIILILLQFFYNFHFLFKFELIYILPIYVYISSFIDCFNTIDVIVALLSLSMCFYSFLP